MNASTTIDLPGLVGTGDHERTLSESEIEAILADGLSQWQLAGSRVLFVIPDGTRTVPLPVLTRLLRKQLSGQVSTLDWLIALGTHPPMNRQAIRHHIGFQPRTGTRVFNHAWNDPGTFASLGQIPAEEIAALSNSMLRCPLDVRINKLVLEYDIVIVVGPVFPHEVVGFSGGNKYFFPGISGQEVIDLTHWLGALLTSYKLIGTLGPNPVRAIIDRAAAMIPTERRCIALTIRPNDAAIHGLWLGTCEEAWSHAADLSSRVHIRYLPRPAANVLALVPDMYPDLWTAAKGMYKLEPVVADGGEIILYAPHIREFSAVHGATLARIGYHCRDYFLKQWDRYQDLPLGVLAHSTHLRGAGTYDPSTGEKCRIKVTLATAIPKAECDSMGLGWRDPATIKPEQWMEEPDGLVVERAGEVLYRLADTT